MMKKVISLLILSFTMNLCLAQGQNNLDMSIVAQNVKLILEIDRILKDGDKSLKNSASPFNTEFMVKKRKVDSIELASSGTSAVSFLIAGNRSVFMETRLTSVYLGLFTAASASFQEGYTLDHLVTSSGLGHSTRLNYSNLGSSLTEKERLKLLAHIYSSLDFLKKAFDLSVGEVVKLVNAINNDYIRVFNSNYNKLKIDKNVRVKNFIEIMIQENIAKEKAERFIVLRDELSKAKKESQKLGESFEIDKLEDLREASLELQSELVKVLKTFNDCKDCSKANSGDKFIENIENRYEFFKNAYELGLN